LQRSTERIEQRLVKTAFLSYYISMYNVVNESLGYEKTSITVDEIYDFINDIKHESGKVVPEIRKEDITFCFYILQVLGLCVDSID
jgi:hypothetical protein